MAAALSHTEGLKAVTFNRVKEATDKDPELVQLREALLQTDYRFTLPEGLQKYNRYRDRLSVLDNTVMYDSRVVVPETLRKEVLEGLHTVYQGVGGMLAGALDTVFWPGIYADLKAVGARCGECNVKQPSQGQRGF